MRTIQLLLFVVGIGYLVSCETPTEDTSEIDQIRADSTAQAKEDSILLDEYIDLIGLDQADVQRLNFDVRYIFDQHVATNRKPDFNEIVSVHMNYRLDDDQIYLTTEEAVAVETDSLAWVERWVEESESSGVLQSFESDTLFIGTSPSDTVLVKGRSLKNVLHNLSNTKEPLDYTLYTNDINFFPTVFNYTRNGTSLEPSHPFALRLGLGEALSDMAIGTNVYILSPSVVSRGSNVDNLLPFNIPVIFEVRLVSIRP